MLKALLKKINRKLKAIKYPYYIINNFFSKKSLVDSGSKYLVSLTSYGERLNTAFYAIESIGFGVEKP